MKPKRYPYTGRKKGPIILQIDQTELCERLNTVEYKNDGLTFGKICNLNSNSSTAKAIEEFDKAYEDFLTADNNEQKIHEAILEDITSRIEKCEMTLKGCVGKYTKKTGSNIKPEEIPGYQEPVLKFDHKRLDAIEFKSDGLTINRI